MTRDKYALCVGLNYPDTDSELNGCVNDANDWADLLGSSGYSVTTSLETSYEDLYAMLEELVAKAGWRDRVVFTYSGHGSWIPDRDGDEADKRDEVLLCSDFEKGGLLSDDEIQTIFSRLAFGAGALIISDSCHSGTISRMASLGQQIHDTAKPRFVSPARFTDLSEAQARTIERTTTVPSRPRRTASLISGCGDLEYSYDSWFGTRANGALTRTALDSYREGIPLRDWHAAIRQTLPSDDYPQTPMLTSANYYRSRIRAI